MKDERQIKMLVVDDEPYICETISDIFEQKGFMVTKAFNGTDALKIAGKKYFNIALIDINLPDIGGIEILKTLKKRYSDMVCIILTGNASFENSIGAFKEGATDFFIKPFDIDFMMHRIDEALEKQWIQHEFIKSEMKYRTLFEESNDAIFIIDPDTGKFIDANQEAVNLTGYRRGKLLKRSVLDIQPTEYRKIIEHWLNKILVLGSIKFNNLKILVKDKKLLDIEINSSIIQFQNEKLIHAIVRDVTLKKKAESELKNAKDNLEKEVAKRTAELQKANKKLIKEIEERKLAEMKLKKISDELARSNSDLEQFVNIASHDMQEPLTKILAFADLTLKNCGQMLGAKEQDYIHRIKKASWRMHDLLNDLLTYSRVSVQSKPFTRVDLKEVVNEILNEFEILISETQAAVYIHDLPMVKADRNQMLQLFQNLISNAIKYRRDGVKPVIKIYSKRDEDRFITGLDDDGRFQVYNIFVEDNGIGFEEKYVENIFKPFQRLHDGKKYMGTGMGLAICKRVVEGHGGRITARSKTGEGSTFVFTLNAWDRLLSLKEL